MELEGYLSGFQIKMQSPSKTPKIVIKAKKTDEQSEFIEKMIHLKFE